MENRKELIKKFRSKVESGKHAGRSTLLAYAYLRDVPYVALERTINEDSFGSEGRNSFLTFLAYSVAIKIACASFDKDFIDMSREERDKYQEISEKFRSLLCEWIQKKYSSSDEVAA